ncbi:hypothetical protein [Nocardiopsis synnemataformans]
MHDLRHTCALRMGHHARAELPEPAAAAHHGYPGSGYDPADLAVLLKETR